MRKTLPLSALPALFAGIATPAWAHAFLANASPAVGSTVRSAPSAVTIHFTEGVEPAFSSITVTDAAGMRVDAGSAQLGAGGDTSLVAPLKALKPGIYTVLWHATATDTHKTRGSFTFTVSPTAAP